MVTVTFISHWPGGKVEVKRIRLDKPFMLPKPEPAPPKN
jgi:hypothetical protein